jgi:hypothetical protein
MTRSSSLGVKNLISASAISEYNHWQKAVI